MLIFLTPSLAVIIDSNITYATVNGTDLQLDIYRPDNYTGDLPVVIWIHGGGWQAGDKADGDYFFEDLTDEGYAAISINYRLSDEAIYPAQIHDVKGAVRWIRANGQTYDLDTVHMAAMGGSAGGHLASLLGTSFDMPNLEGDVGGNELYSSRVSAVVDLYGPVNLKTLHQNCLVWGCAMDHSSPTSPESLLLGGPLLTKLNLAKAASPQHFVNGDEPPFLIIHGDQDVAIPLIQSVKFKQRLDNVGANSTFIVATGFGHGLQIRGAYYQDIIDFLDLNLKNQPTSADEP